MTKHTPGPWKVRDFNADWGESGATFDIDSEKGHVGFVTRSTFQVDDEECISNARLIAAAPELLKACKAAFVIIRDMDGEAEGTVKDFLQKAIAHAEASQ